MVLGLIYLTTPMMSKQLTCLCEWYGGEQDLRRSGRHPDCPVHLSGIVGVAPKDSYTKADMTEAYARGKLHGAEGAQRATYITVARSDVLVAGARGQIWNKAIFLANEADGQSEEVYRGYAIGCRELAAYIRNTGKMMTYRADLQCGWCGHRFDEHEGACTVESQVKPNDGGPLVVCDCAYFQVHDWGTAPEGGVNV